MLENVVLKDLNPDSMLEVNRSLVVYSGIPGNWLDGRFVALFEGNQCAALVFNQMIRCQTHFAGPFFQSCKQFKKSLLQPFSKNTITRAIKLICKVVPGVLRWFGKAGDRLRVSHYALDLELIRAHLRAVGLQDYLEPGDEGYPFKVHKVEVIALSEDSSVEQPEPKVEKERAKTKNPEIIPVVPAFFVPPHLASSYAWKTLSKRFAPDLSLEFVDFLLAKITERGLSQLEKFVYQIEKQLEQGHKVSNITAYLKICYQNLSTNFEASIQNLPSKVTPSLSELSTSSVKPKLEDFKLPPGLEIDAQWELKNVIYTVWDIQKQFVHLKDPSGQVTAFKLERVIEGRAYPQII